MLKSHQDLGLHKDKNCTC